jgi:predicted aspartyl protease
MARLEFSHFYSYSTDQVSLPIVMRNGTRALELAAFVDTGASHCLFRRESAERLQLELEAGEPKVFWSAGGPVKTFGHLVQIVAFGMVFDSTVYFFADPAINKNLLGRIGWLDRVRLGLVDHDRELYLAPYDS